LRREIDEENPVFSREIPDRLDVELQILVAGREIGMSGPGPAEGRRREQDDALRAPGKLGQQALVGFREARDALLAVQRFELSELDEEDARSRPAELVGPGSEIQRTRLLVDRVAFPGHVAEADRLARAAQREERLEVPLIEADPGILAAHEGD